MPTSTVEDYLKIILIQEQRLSPGELVNMGQIATGLGVAPGTVTAMAKTLQESGLLSYEPYSGVRLTQEGRQLAMHVLRRHRLIELFLVQVLSLDWSEVHDEAERLEHAMSDKLIERIDEYLGRPRTDPHGDPIPDSRGQLPPDRLVCLVDCAPGDRVRLARVSDQDEGFLRFAKRHGLEPGVLLEVQSNDPEARALALRIAESAQLTLGEEAAAKLWVEPEALAEPVLAQEATR